MEYTKFPPIYSPNQQVPSSPLAKALMSRYTHDKDVAGSKGSKGKHLSKSITTHPKGY